MTQPRNEATDYESTRRREFIQALPDQSIRYIGNAPAALFQPFVMPRRANFECQRTNYLRVQLDFWFSRSLPSVALQFTPSDSPSAETVSVKVPLCCPSGSYHVPSYVRSPVLPKLKL